ncbi:HTH-type transcriptional activator Btr [compost metagenome]
MFEFKNTIRRSNGKPNDLTRLSCFYHVLDTLSAQLHVDESTKVNHESWLQKGREYIDIHYADGINVERVSTYIGVERTYFTKQFTKYYGVTPIRYLQNLKMNEGKKLLQQSTYTLSEIASSLGYPDLFSFSKAFKKMEGISPSQFRSQSFYVCDLDIKNTVPSE